MFITSRIRSLPYQIYFTMNVQKETKTKEEHTKRLAIMYNCR